MTNKHLHSWRRFSVLALVVTAFMSAPSCSKILTSDASDQQAAIAAIEKLGGVYLGGEHPRVVFSGPSVKDADLAHVACLSELVELDLAITGVTDAGLAQLAGLEKLKSLQLDRTQVTDAGLMQLAGLTELRVLSLCDTQVTDEGVAALKKSLPNLRTVR